jgi:hypothetical protein
MRSRLAFDHRGESVVVAAPADWIERPVEPISHTGRDGAMVLVPKGGFRASKM